MCELQTRLSVGLCPGLTSEVLNKLQQNGVYTVGHLISQKLEKLAATTQISCKKLVTIRHVLSAQFAALPVSAAVQFDDIMKSVSILSTGSKQLNEYLDGGIYTKEIMELVGEVASGKTQFCQSVAIELAVNAKLSTLWIDTCGSFDLMRLQVMLEKRQLNDKELNDACSCIQLIRAFKPLDMLSALERVKHILSVQRSGSKDIRLIIIDTVSVFLSPLLSRCTLEGFSMMVHVTRSLKDIVSDYPVAILMTNSLIGSSTQQTKLPPLGRLWASLPNTRLWLHREPALKIHPNHLISDVNQPIERVAVLVKSCRQACQGGATFDVTDYGIRDT